MHYNHGATTFRSDATGGLLTGCPVRSTTLAALRDDHGPFDLIKIDAEGMEDEIVESDSQYLAQGQSTLWLECNESPASLDLAEKLLGWGLDVFYFAFPAHNADNFLGCKQNLLPMAYESGLLAAPRAVPMLSTRLEAAKCFLEPINNPKDLKRALWRTPRWGLPEWDVVTRETIVAEAVHKFFGETFDSYLEPGWERGAPLWAQLSEAQAAIVEGAAERTSLRNDLAEANERIAELEHKQRIALQSLEAEHAAGKALDREREASDRPVQSYAAGGDSSEAVDRDRDFMPVCADGHRLEMEISSESNNVAE